MSGTRLSSKHFETYKRECEKWISELGLKDWKVWYRFEGLEGALAGCRTDYEGRCVTLILNPWQEGCKGKDVDLGRLARHEVLHLLLAELRALNNKRCITPDVWESAEHGVIRRLEKALVHGKPIH
jgi:hypothetical protein